MTLNNIDIKNYNKNGVIVVKNVFKRKEINLLKKKLIYILKIIALNLKVKKLILSRKR